MTRKIAFRSGLAASAALTMLGFATAAHAQDDAAQPASRVPVAAPANGEPVIIVTAQRREQTLAQVPQSLAVVGGDTLERQQATTFLDYVQLVPGLNITQENPGESRVIIRGINTNSVDSTVSIYVDDTPFGSSGSLSNGGVLAGDFDTFDIARIEVLRGPQGTLYGSNALGGTLKFVTATPDTRRFEARGRAGVEFVDDGGTGWMGNAMVNVPLGDTLAFRASGFYRRNAGWIDATGRSGTNINEADSYGGRASLLYRPSDNFSVRLLALAQNINSNSPSTFDADPVTFRPVNAITGLPSEDKTRFERFAEYNDIAYRLYSGTVNWDFGFANLTSATSYSTLDQNNFSDLSNTGNRGTANFLYAPTAPNTIGLAFQADITTHKFTQEVRLASPNSDSFEWLIGGYYTHEKSGLLQRFRPFTLATQALLPTPFTFGGTNFTDFVRVTLDSDYEELAAFASATWHLSDRFDITAGARYSHNSQTSTQVSAILSAPATINGDSSEGVFTWSVAPRFELNDRVSLYARVAKGYRPGGPNAVPPGAPANFLSSFEADTLVSYEAGLRAETPDRTFAIDASIYRLDWDNILITTVFIDPATGTQFGANGNGRRARSTGADVSATLRPVRGLRAVLNLAYTDAKLLDDTTPAPGIPNITGGRAGDRLPYTPRYTANLSVDYEWALAASARAFVGANVRVVSDQTAGFSQAYRAAFNRLIVLDGYGTVDLRAGVDFDHFSVSAYVRNLTNTDGLVNVGGFPRQIPAVVGGTNRQLVNASTIRPRTIGLTVGFQY